MSDKMPDKEYGRSAFATADRRCYGRFDGKNIHFNKIVIRLRDAFDKWAWGVKFYCFDFIHFTVATTVKIDRLIQILLPHDEKFYTLFEEMTKLLLKASVALRKIPDSDLIQTQTLVKEIEDLEHEADEVTHAIFAELNATFVTPFDREDIHELASALDDIMDYINGSASRFVLYNVHQRTQYLRRLNEIIQQSVEAIGKGVSYLRDFRNSASLQEILKKVNEYENEADTVFALAVADLFENEKNVIELIKLKEIYVELETATDRCEDVANVLESILIKHA